MAGSKGLVLMAPPAGNAEAQKTLAGMLSSIKPKTKVCGVVSLPVPCSKQWLAVVLMSLSTALLQHVLLVDCSRALSKQSPRGS